MLIEKHLTMGKTQTHKEHHFVPKTYLRKWCIKEGKKETIKAYNINSKKISEQEIKNICKKKNLYTLPHNQDISINGGKKVIEHLFSSVYEQNWSKVIDRLIEESYLNNDDLVKLINFIYIQSIRTLKFKIDNEIALENNHNISDSDKLLYPYYFSFLMIKGTPRITENATVKIYTAPISKRFITSDNPSSFWLFEGRNFTNITSLLDEHIMLKNENFKILCPLSPYHLAILTPNIELYHIKRSFNQDFIPLREGEVNFFNLLIEISSNKQLFAKYVDDFNNNFTIEGTLEKKELTKIITKSGEKPLTRFHYSMDISTSF
ncbi:MAG: DUF4238 domain-containing protein [Bacteroidota bacterium]